MSSIAHGTDFGQMSEIPPPRVPAAQPLGDGNARAGGLTGPLTRAIVVENVLCHIEDEEGVAGQIGTSYKCKVSFLEERLGFRVEKSSKKISSGAE